LRQVLLDRRFPAGRNQALVSESLDNKQPESQNASILYVSSQDVLRSVRDRMLSMAGYEVDSSESSEEAREKIVTTGYDLVLIDIGGQHEVRDAEEFCSEIKTANPDQRVAFVCNWRVAILSECPDDVVRSEFDPVAFVSGVKQALANGRSN
jgi:CheY-like chemotaxis protein